MQLVVSTAQGSGLDILEASLCVSTQLSFYGHSAHATITAGDNRQASAKSFTSAQVQYVVRLKENGT